MTTDNMVEPCEGAVAHSDHAAFDQRWCMKAGRYCRHAPVQQCARSTASINSTDGPVTDAMIAAGRNFIAANGYSFANLPGLYLAMRSASPSNDNALREAAQFALDELKYMPRALSQWAGGMGRQITAVRKRLRAALNLSSDPVGKS